VPTWIHTLTVDASFSTRNGLTGIGIVVQERISPKRRRGPILDQIAESHAGVHPGTPRRSPSFVPSKSRMTEGIRG